MEKFKKLVEQRTNGVVQVQVFPGGELYSDKDAINALGTGSVQMVWPITTVLTSFAKELGVVDLPFLFEDVYMQNTDYRKDLIKIFSPYLEPKDLKLLAVLRSADSMVVTKDKEIKKPEDLKGMKIRVVPGKMRTAMFQALGTTPVGMAASEMTTALSQGVIDGINTSPDGWFNIIGITAKYGVVVPGMLLTTHSIVVSKSWWEGLPPDIQEVIIKTLDELGNKQWQDNINKNNEMLKEMEKKGAKIYYVPPEEVEQWKKVLQTVYDKEGAEYSEQIKAVNDLKNKYKDKIKQ